MAAKEAMFGEMNKPSKYLTTKNGRKWWPVRFDPSPFHPMRISEKDKLRYGDGDPDFNEEHNKDVIANTIKKTDANHKRKQKMWDEGLLERSDAVYSYIRHTALGGKSDTPIEQYLGKEYFMKLLGQERLRDLKRRASVPNLSNLKSN